MEEGNKSGRTRTQSVPLAQEAKKAGSVKTAKDRKAASARWQPKGDNGDKVISTSNKFAAL
ncbi:hypothetical protein R6Q59_031727 [Mikania micrantha]